METMNLTSKMISSASYDVAASALLIKLNDGSVRRIKAPRIMYENLISAESPGWYYMRHIRPLK
ncbi:KTSC domain-containing protein [Rhizobium sp. PP-F2F-G48]|nr:KTSC domain-containing protein [Rhizobium sp. PP-F2F-G48]TCM57756.1 KTSC domain-containing protein [Rhizobium sp. PP-F2F-G48]